MDFKPRKIRKLSGKGISISASLIISITIIVLLITGIAKAISSIDFTVFLEIAGEELQQDSFGHTNFLLLGTGDKEHEGGNLTDTIIVASLDRENHLVTMVSIPRDLYISDDVVGSSRINESFYRSKVYYGSDIEGIEHMKNKVEEIAGIPIHYWVKVNFQGFKDLIDAIGGVDVTVKDAIYDPYYPKDETFEYEVFQIDEGLHHMDGELALKYARSRKTTSDFDRADRQQEILYAIKEQALNTEVILSKEKIENILTVLKENISTNLKIKEMLTLGSMADEFTPDSILHRLIHDDPYQCGGFLYTPMREAYGGQFVLLPAGGNEYLHMYSDLNFNLPYIAKENTKIYILNGTSSGGVAGEAKTVLNRYCFDVVGRANAESPDKEVTTYYFKTKYDEDGNPIEEIPLAMDFLEKMIPATQTSFTIPTEYEQYMQEADIIIEIGYDYVNSPNYIDDPFYYLPAAVTTSSTEGTTTEDEN